MRQSFRFLLVSCAILLSVVFFSLAAALDLQSNIDPLAKPLIEKNAVVGFVVGIVKDGETQFIGYGETLKGSGNKPDPETVYEIGSISKVFTGVLLADMVESGAVQLDEPVQKLLPETVRMPVFDDKPITLQDLATQTSGLPRLPIILFPADLQNPYADYTVEQLYKFLNGVRLTRAPGKYEYSNLGMGLLGHVLALRDGKTYEQLLSDRITKPLGLVDTSVTLSDSQRERLAPPYNGALNPEKNWDLPTLVGAGGIRSTGRDLLAFAQANLAADENKTDGKPLAKAMRLSHEERHKMEDGLAIGLAWHIARDGVTHWHNGMTGGYHSWVAFVPGKNVATMVLANTATGKITELGEQITRVACGEEVDPPKERKQIDVEESVLETYVGSYALSPQFVLTVALENGQLMVQATGQQKFPVFAESKTDFFYKVVDAQITFKPDENGRVDKLILHQNGRDLEATRQ